MHNLTLPAARRNTASNITECEMAAYCTKWLAPSSAVLSVFGEIDAANSREFTDYVMLHLPHVRELVLDLTGVAFFGTAAFSALHTMGARAGAEGIDWTLVPSHAVSRLLRICDADSVLPVEESVASALLRLERDPSDLLQIVAKAR
jgi:anti-anti-sigma factor